jgi:predicted NBD/HSP70 family sugar kinase
VTTSIDRGQHAWWLASRSVGVVAMVLVSLSVALGLAMSGRIVRGPGVAARLKTFHEALALSGLWRPCSTACCCCRTPTSIRASWGS